MPRALLAVSLPHRRILAVDVSCASARTPSLSKLMDHLETATITDGNPVKLRAPHCSPIERATIGAMSREDAIGKPTLSRILGHRIGDLAVMYQAGKSKSAGKLLRGRHACPISPADALNAINTAVDVHNARLAPLPEEDILIRSHSNGRARSQ